MGRGERSKKKRRFRSLSPVGRGTPSAEGGSGYGGQGGGLQEGYVTILALCIVILELTTTTGSDKHGDAHTAGSGELPSGLFATVQKAHVLSATTAATSTNETRNFHLGRKTSSTTKGHNMKFNNTDRSGDRLIAIWEGVYFIGVRGSAWIAVIHPNEILLRSWTPTVGV